MRFELPHLVGLSSAMLGAYALGLFDVPDAHAEALVAPESFESGMFDPLDRLLEQVHSGHVTADSIEQLHDVVQERIQATEELIRAMHEVAPDDAREIVKLKNDVNELKILEGRLAVLEMRIDALDSAGATGYRVNRIAAEGAKELMPFDADAHRSTYLHVADLYKNVTFGEVLVTDKNGNLLEKQVHDLFVVDDPKSAKISPVLAHRLVTIIEKTGITDGWKLTSGAFEHPTAHLMIGGKPASDHIAPPEALDTVDIRPVKGDGLDPLRLAKYALAAKEDPYGRFFQIETGKDYSVKQMQDAFAKELSDKLKPHELEYVLSKIVKNGSGVHIHAEFNTPTFYAKYSPAQILASR